MKSGQTIVYKVEGESDALRHHATLLSAKEVTQYETKEYIDDVVQLRNDDPDAEQTTIRFLLGTDNRYYLDGKRILVLDGAES
jgi:hypothetical protein